MLKKKWKRETVAHEPVAVVINPNEAKEKLDKATTLDDLKNIWAKELTADQRNVPELIKYKDDLKVKLTPKA